MANVIKKEFLKEISDDIKDMAEQDRLHDKYPWVSKKKRMSADKKPFYRVFLEWVELVLLAACLIFIVVCFFYPTTHDAFMEFFEVTKNEIMAAFH